MRKSKSRKQAKVLRAKTTRETKKKAKIDRKKAKTELLNAHPELVKFKEMPLEEIKKMVEPKPAQHAETTAS